MKLKDFFLNGEDYGTMLGPATPETKFLNPRWLDLPIRAPGNDANRYITGTGVALFDSDPPWKEDVLNRGFLLLEFGAESPLQANDKLIDGCATVGPSLLERDTKGGDWAWALAIDGTRVIPPDPGDTTLDVIVYLAYKTDVWVDHVAYQINLLVHRPPVIVGARHLGDLFATDKPAVKLLKG